MKIMTEKQYDELIDEIQRNAFKDGFNKGYKMGLNKGLTTDKEGIHMSSIGIHVFKDGKFSEIKNID